MLNTFLHNERVVKSHDPADEWELREIEREAKRIAEEICPECGEEKAWDELDCEKCYIEKHKNEWRD